MSTHTPGPWRASGFSVYSDTPQDVDHTKFLGFDKREEHGGQEVGFLIAESIPHEPTRRLISAAPVLLAALENITAAHIALLDMAGFDEARGDVSEVLTKALDAIVQAKGEL